MSVDAKAKLLMNAATAAQAAPIAVSADPRPAARNGRDELLKAANALMNERDTVEISLSEIAALAGVNSALVKYHFGNKRGLLVALLERDVGASMGQLSELVASDRTATEKLRIHIAGTINLYFRYRYVNLLLRGLLRDRSSPPSEAQLLSDRLIKPAIEAQAAILEEGWAAGEFRRVDAMLLYFTLMGACDVFFSSNFALKTVFGREQIDDQLRREFIDHTTSILLKGIAAAPA